mgnify:CR=1 FL=1
MATVRVFEEHVTSVEVPERLLDRHLVVRWYNCVILTTDDVDCSLLQIVDIDGARGTLDRSSHFISKLY